jgi:hypothetical protein
LCFLAFGSQASSASTLCYGLMAESTSMNLNAVRK